LIWPWKKKKFEEENKQLIETREIIIEGEINEKVADDIVKKIIMLEEYSVSDDINLYLKDNKASIASIFTIHDNIKHIKAPVATFANGNISGLSVLLLSSGTKGKRYIFENSRIGLLPVTKLSENLTKEDEAYLVSMKRKIYELLCNNTNQPYYKIENDCEELLVLDAKSSIRYGIADNIINR
jgi:ATP-dependent Clp protease protease subunit